MGLEIKHDLHLRATYLVFVSLGHTPSHSILHYDSQTTI